MFEDAIFSYSMLKLSFISSLTSWAGLIPDLDHYIVGIFLCIL